MTALSYDNRTGRPPGRVVQGLGLLVPGVARVRRQAEPWGKYWHAHNNDLLREPTGRRRWVVLGDSMSQGVGAREPWGGWVGRVADRLAAAGHELDVLNLSATGARVADVLTQQLAALDGLVRDGHLDPDLDRNQGEPAPLVSVMVGSNDLFAGRRARARLPQDADRLLAALPRGAVVCTLPQPSPAADAVNRSIEAARRAHAVRVIDMRTEGPTSWRGRLASDWFHPNDAGYEALADACEPTLRRVLDGADGV